jgi:hypothetical protein
MVGTTSTASKVDRIDMRTTDGTSALPSPKRRPVRALALWSGFLGATASCAAKFAFSSAPTHGKGANEGAIFLTTFPPHGLTAVSVALRAAAVALMILCNAGMLGSFLEGMEESGSVAATSLASAANFVASAAYGRYVWGERLADSNADGAALYAGGLAMIVAGVLLLSTVRTKSTKVE